MIRAILFDLGGVIIDIDLDRCLNHFRTELGYSDIDKLLDKSFQRGIYSRLEEGVLSADDFRAEVLQGCRPGTTASDVDTAVWSLLGGIDSRKPSLLESLSERFDIYMLSNNNPISMEKCHQIMAESGIDEDRIFKAEFLSWQMRLLKPSEQIFRKVAEGIGLPMEQILFIDDSIVNISAAKELGFSTLHYVQGDDLGARISEALAGEGVC